MKLADFIAGLQLLSNYYNDKNGYHIGAEHDQFYAFATDFTMDDEDVAKMLSIGWFQPDGISEDGGVYAQEESWSAFT